jgi:hypothetical protein
MFLPIIVPTAHHIHASVRALLPLAALLFLAGAYPCAAQVEEALVTAPDLFAPAGVDASMAGSGLAAIPEASVQASAPAIALHNPVHLRGPLWHTADVEGGQTEIRPAAPYAQCRCFSADGGNGAFAYHLTDHFGVAANGSRMAAGSPDQPVNLTSYLFGPEASVMVGRHVVGFGHVLAGKTDLQGQDPGGRPFSSSSVAMGWGGGLDLVLNRDTSLRLAQVDSFLHLLPHSVHVRQSDLRLTFGVVFRFGR